MSNFIYSIICEDDAQKLFIETFISRIANEKISFSFNENFFWQFKSSNNKDVIKNYVQAADFTFLDAFYADLIFIGIDYDDRPRNNFHAEYKELYNKIVKKAISKTIILFPVQAMEHWLLFIKRKKDNPSLTKNITAEIERIERRKAKETLYAGVGDRKDFIIDLVKAADIDWLENQSISFRKFLSHLNEFISTSNK